MLRAALQLAHRVRLVPPFSALALPSSSRAIGALAWIAAGPRPRRARPFPFQGHRVGDRHDSTFALRLAARPRRDDRAGRGDVDRDARGSGHGAVHAQRRADGRDPPSSRRGAAARRLHPGEQADDCQRRGGWRDGCRLPSRVPLAGHPRASSALGRSRVRRVDRPVRERAGRFRHVPRPGRTVRTRSGSSCTARPTGGSPGVRSGCGSPFRAGPSSPTSTAPSISPTPTTALSSPSPPASLAGPAAAVSTARRTAALRGRSSPCRSPRTPTR